MKAFFFYSIIQILPFIVFADWLGFRGTHGNGLISEEIPHELSLNSHDSWETTLPGRGLSSPVLVGDLVFLTSSSGSQQADLHILAFNTITGKQVWERTFKATGRTI